MSIVATICGIVLIVLVLWEGFETIVLPRRVTRRFRLTRLFYRQHLAPLGEDGQAHSSRPGSRKPG